MSQDRLSRILTRQLAMCLLLAAGLFAALGMKPQLADAGVSGQLEQWGEVFVGTSPGELFNPHQLGVDPVDGSVYITSVSPNFSQLRVDKFSSTGNFEASVTIPRAVDEPGATGRKGFVGIAVDHETVPGDPESGRIYLIQSENGLETSPAAPVATKILVFSTVPQSGNLVAEPSITLPAANSAETLLWPNELHVDPSNGDLVFSAVNPAERPVLQRYSSAGVKRNRYEETGTSLRAQRGETGQVGSPGELSFGFDIAADGTTDIVTNTGVGGSSPADNSIEGFTLPPEFISSGGSLTLAPIPGFTAATTDESWPDEGASLLVHSPPHGTSQGFGPQVALVNGTGGEETLFWKAGNNESEQAEVRIHGYSLQQQGTNAVYGGGPLNAAPEECSIESRAAAIAPTTSGDLMVLDQGAEIEEEGESPFFGPNVLRFGPGGGSCPDPALSVKLEGSTGTEITAPVPAGTNVTFNAGGSEFGGGGIQPAELIWKIAKVGGSTVSLPAVVGSPASLEQEHVFSESGEYTIQLALKTNNLIENIGKGFVAKSKKLVVTAATTHTLTITKTGTGNGTVQCEIGGTTAACPTTVNDGTQVKVLGTPDGSSELGTVSGTGSATTCTALPCTFTAAADSTVSVEFKPKAVVVKHKLTIGTSGSGSGTVQCDSGACAAEYGEHTEVTLTAVPAADSTFVGWEGGGCSGTSTCKVVIGSSDVQVTAIFDKTPPPSNNNNQQQQGNQQPNNNPPSNTVKPGTVKASGSAASLTVTVPGPGTLAASGKGVIATKVNAKGAGPVQLKLKLTGAAKKTLAKKGKVTVKVKVVFTPTGGSPGTITKTITFKSSKGKGAAGASSLLRLLPLGFFS